MAYDGQEQTNTLTRLEAFMYQAKEFQSRKNKMSYNLSENLQKNVVCCIRDFVKKITFHDLKFS